ncbi:MAG: RNA polymerase sigma factor [Acidobacteriia bacterium]|nr:RNA polymerase sigma factor [Terriglobia bacterium]
MAAQSTTVASMYPAGAEASPNRAMEPRDAVSQLRLVPARSAQPQIGKGEAVAIIPEMRWEDLTDEALIARYRAEAGQASAEQYLNELFRRHHVKVARWCLSVTGDRESAADLAQEICVKAYQNLSYFKGQSKFSTWLYSITRNHCLNAVRSRASAPQMDTDELLMETLPDVASDSPLAHVERKQQADIARQMMNETLEETEKAVFTMHFAEELPLDVITRMLNLNNASGAKAYLVSAKRKLDRAAKRWKARA